MRELNVLVDMKQKFPHNNIRVSRIAGLVPLADDNSVAGILLDYITPGYLDAPSTLRYKHYEPKEDREKWARQVRETVKQLHDADIVWGDVHADNVMLDNNGDAWVINFGGGNSNRWIDWKKLDTKEGDLQGLSNIEKYLGDDATEEDREYLLEGSDDSSSDDGSLPENSAAEKKDIETNDIERNDTKRNDIETKDIERNDGGVAEKSGADTKDLDTLSNAIEHLDIKAVQDAGSEAKVTK
jgi:hypothetical protein